MRGRRAIELAVESIESRRLLSGVTSSVHLLAKPLHAHVAVVPVLTLQATVQGTFTALPHAVGYATPYKIHATANLPGLGKTTISGTINAPGGEIDLVTSRGKIILTNFSSAYSIDPTVTYELGFRSPQGTGAYQNLTGVGFLTFRFNSGQSPSGRMSLTINSHAFGAASRQAH